MKRTLISINKTDVLPAAPYAFKIDNKRKKYCNLGTAVCTESITKKNSKQKNNKNFMARHPIVN